MNIVNNYQLISTTLESVASWETTTTTHTHNHHTQPQPPHTHNHNHHTHNHNHHTAHTSTAKTCSEFHSHLIKCQRS